MGSSCNQEEELCWKMMKLALQSEKQYPQVAQIMGDYLAEPAAEGALLAFISSLPPHVVDSDQDLRLASIRAVGLVVPSIPLKHLYCHLQSLVDLTSGRLMDDPSSTVRSAAALSMAALADTTAPHRFETFVPLLKPLCSDMVGLRGKHQGRVLAGFLIVLSSIIKHMDEIHASYFAEQVLGQVFGLVYQQRQLKIAGQCDGESVRTLLRILRQCVRIRGPEVDSAMCWLVPMFIGFFWAPSAAPVQQSHHKQLLEVTVVFAERLGLLALFKAMTDEILRENKHSWRHLIRAMEIVGEAANHATTIFDVNHADNARLLQKLLRDMLSLFTYPSSL